MRCWIRAIKSVAGCAPILVVILCCMNSSAAQQTTSFTYQGRLTDGGSVANGSYDLQFTLWDSASGGTQQPQPAPVTVTKSAVSVSGGIFTTQLDFTVNTHVVGREGC